MKPNERFRNEHAELAIADALIDAYTPPNTEKQKQKLIRTEERRKKVIAVLLQKERAPS